LASDLTTVFAEALAHLGQGATNPGSPWRNLALASVGLDGAPQIRTVVLRSFDSAARRLDVHTDTRSTKHAELTANPFAALHGWDSATHIQLRASGGVTLHNRDVVAAQAWADLRPASRATYRVRPGPGTKIEHPESLAQGDDADGYACFCVVRLHLARLEYLHLGQTSHRRARFEWADGARIATWLVP
jgi:hypothetical protein